MNALEDPGHDLLSPKERLEASRARLRKSWLREESAEQAAQRVSEDDSVIHRFTDLIAAGWERHPLKASFDAAASVAGPVLRSSLGPAARSHPLRLVALAAGLGVLLVWVRPWRLLSRAAFSSILISAIIPKAAIARWWASGQWLDLLKSEGLQSWFAAHTPPADASPRTSSAPGGQAAPGVDASSEAPASYARPAPSPIAATSAAS